MTCIKKIKSEEISGSTFRGREISLIVDITDYSFIAKVKSPFQGKITEIAGIKNASKVFFSFESIKDLRNGKYIIEYWGDFAELGEEVFLVEELSIVSAEKSSGNCSNETHIFDVKINNITIPISLDFSVVNIYNNSGSSSWGSIGGDIENQADLIQKFGNYYTKTEVYNKNEVNSELNNKQDKLNADVLGQVLDTELSIKITPSDDDEVVILDSINGEAATVKFSSFGGNVDTSDLVPYTGATKDVNIGANYFKTSKGFDFTLDENNYFRTSNNGEICILDFLSKDESEYNFGSIELTATPEIGFIIAQKDNNGLLLNNLQVNKLGTYSEKPFISDVGFKIPTGTANQSLTANGGVFDLNTKADLDGGKVPSSQLPSYVDDVLEYANLASFPATGESGKIYIAIDTNLTYRWGGSSYVVMSSSLALGETSSTAYRGDRGKIAYDHSQVTGNPHNTTKSDIGLGNVPNIDATNPTNIVQTSSYRFVTDSEKTNLSTAYNHSQTTGNPHNTKVEELTDVGSETTSIIDTDVILKKESGGLWKKITFANFKNWFTTELAKKINIGLDTVFNFKNISAMTLAQFKALTPDIETIYFTEEQNATGWQQIRYNGLDISIPATTETLVTLTNENYIELDSDSTFNLIDVANTKINGIFEKDFVIIKFNAGVVTPATANQWFKVILKINGVQTAVSPVFYLTETSGTVEQIAHNFSLNVPAEMVTNGATLHLKTSATMTFNNPAISVVRVHKSTNANL